MNKAIITSLVGLGLFAMTGTATAGGKPPGAFCHTHKSCSTKVCAREAPADKFGVCCAPQDCASLGAQCGIIDNGCGTPINCQDCDPASICVNNTCVPVTTTTTSTTTTTTTTSTTTTIPPTTTTTPPTTSTTLGCIPEFGTCQQGGDDNCCGAADCEATEPGGSTFQCLTCAATGGSCAVVDCCFGLCEFLESQPVCTD